MNTSKKHYLYILAIIYLTTIYMIPALYLLSMDTKAFVVLIPMMVTIISAIVVPMIKKDVSKEDLLGATILVKYGMIPFYAVGSLINCLLLLAIVIPLPFMLAMTAVGLILAWMVGWLFMMGSTPFSLTYLSKAKKENSISNSLRITTIICQFFFVADVISIMVLCFKEKKYVKTTVGVIIGSLLLIALILFGLIAYA